MNIVPLNVISGYSFLKSSIKIEQFLEMLKKENISICGITDINTLFGFPYFYKSALKNDITPLFGMEIQIEGNYLCLFIKNEEGYASLIKLSLFLSKNNEVSLEDLKNFSKGLVCVFSTYNSNLLSSLKEETYHFVAKQLKKIEDIFERNFYIGIYSESLINEENISYKYSTQALTRKFLKTHPFDFMAFPRFTAMDNESFVSSALMEHYQTSESNNLAEFELNSQNIKNISKILYDEETYNKFYTEQEILNTHIFSSKFKFEFNQKRGKMLRFCKEFLDSKQLIEKLCIEGLKNKGLINDPKYVNRLEYELKIIDEMGYNDYFLIVQDYVNFGKKNNILVGPGRGSAAGSLVAYALNITEVDPLKYNLLFERFLNPERLSMPDIDVDFEDIKRNKIIEHLLKSYGEHRVGLITTFQQIKSKQAIRDIGRIFTQDIEQIDIDNLSKMLTNPRYSLQESYDNIENFKNTIDNDRFYKTIFDLAKKIENYPRQRGLHAAGVILNNDDITSSLPVVYDNEQNMLVSQYEMNNLEEQGFLKMDILGLTNLSTIHFILDLIKKNHGIDIKFSDIDINDPEIYENLINKGLTMGLFQLESEGMNRAINLVKPQCFNDIVSILALFRPGPMEYISTFAERKNGKQEYKINNPILKEILGETYGIIVYQEQIMLLANKIAGFSLAEADIFRRAISKKKHDEMIKLKDKFIKGCLKNKHSEIFANKLFNIIVKFADYGFNKSHSVAYAMITCRMAWLKLHYPNEFYIALLQANQGTNNTKFLKFIEEFKVLNIKIGLPDINKSGVVFTSDNSTMIMPLSSIKGLLSETIYKILDARQQYGKFDSLTDFVIKTKKYNISNSQIEKLIKAGCFDYFMKNRKAMLDKLEILVNNISISQRLNLLQDFNESEISFDENTKEDLITKINEEYALLDVMISLNPINIYKEKHSIVNDFVFSNLQVNKQYEIVAMVLTKKVIFTKKTKKQMAFLNIMDENGTAIEAVCFPDTYSKYFNLTDKSTVALFKGKLEINEDKKSFIIEEIRGIQYE